MFCYQRQHFSFRDFMSEKFGNIKKVWANQFQETKGEYEAWELRNFRIAALFKLGSAEPQSAAVGCQWFRETIMSICGTVLLLVLAIYVRIKIRVATFDTNLPVTDSKQSIAASIQKLLNSAIKSVSGDCRRIATDSQCARRHDQVIDQFEVSCRFFTCNVLEGKHMLVLVLYLTYCGQAGVPQ